MLIRRLSLGVVALLFLANMTFAQSRRFNELAARLETEARDFADSSYRGYTDAFRNRREDIEALMLAQQFYAAAQLFNRMVNDRRRQQELRDAFQLLEDITRSLDRNNLQRNRWFDVQRLVSDVSRELNYGYPGDNQYPTPGFAFRTNDLERQG